jgi:hypothetical protein
VLAENPQVNPLDKLGQDQLPVAVQVPSLHLELGPACAIRLLGLANFRSGWPFAYFGTIVPVTVSS